MPPSKPPPPAFSTSYALSKFRMQRPAQAWLCGRPKAERRILPVVATHTASCDSATVVEAGVCSVS